MKSILRATVILSTGSIVSILFGLASSKVLAVLIGPSGYGYWGLLQSLVGLSALIAVGIGAGLVREGANALAHEDYMQVASLRAGAWLLLGMLGGLGVVLMTLFRMPISRWMLGGTEHAWSVALMGVALLFSLAAGLQDNTLNAYHRVEALARVSVVTAVFCSCISIVTVWLLGLRGIVPAIIAGAAARCAVSHYFLRREVGLVAARPARRKVLEAAKWLLLFNGPYTASMMVGGGVQLALPVLVLHILGREGVGFYKAATLISLNYLGFLLTALGYDYYPRASAVRDKPHSLIHLINEQHRLIMLLAVPIILGALALVPYVIPILYTRQFYPTAELLEWQLIGDLFKLSSWTMAYVILARSSSSTYFCIELICGLTAFLTSWVGMRWFGLSGLGIAFIATYIVYYLVVWFILKRDIGLTWTAENKRLIFVAVAAAAVIRILPSTPLASSRTAVALSLAAIVGARSIYVIWRETGVKVPANSELVGKVQPETY